MSRKKPDSVFCSICLDILKIPVTLPCGHNYCKVCINRYWDREGHKGVCSCPQCRQTFTTRPVLNKNTVLADLVKKMSGSAGQTSAVMDEAGPGEVECDFCTAKKLKAVKSCLVCLASYCATHLQPHYESAAFQRHKLVEVSASMQEKICPKHDKLLEVYCRTDGQCVCLLCVMDEHKGHDTVSAAAERKDKQKQFGEKKQKFQQGIQEKERQLHELRQNIKALERSGDAAVDENEKAYAEMILMADKRRGVVKELIGVQQRAAVSRAEELVDRLEKGISGLRKGEDELKQLSITEDHIHFLQRCQSIFHSDESDVSEVDLCLHAPFDFVTKDISNMRDKLEKMAKTIAEISEEIQDDPGPKTREEFSLYLCRLCLDPNTASVHLLLSEGNSKVTWVKKAQPYPFHPDRFLECDQVLCTEGLSGVSYWEVEWQGPRAEVALCYKGAQLEESALAYWCISLSNSGCSFWSGGLKTKIATQCSSTVGVYLNHKAGSLSFYSVSASGEMTLLHRVQATFSHPLYPGFMVSRGASVRIISPKEKTSTAKV